MAPTLDIRRLVRSEAAAYRSLMLDGYRVHGDAFTATVDERGGLPIAWWEARIDADFVVGAWSGAALVGVAGLAEETRPKTRHKSTLFGMYVDARHGRHGIGEALVTAVLDEATARKTLRVVQLTVTEGNRSAQTLYERCGFVAFGIEPYAITVGDGYRAKIHMWLDLVARSKAALPRRHEAARA